MDRTNVIVIVCDDLGYGSTSPRGTRTGWFERVEAERATIGDIWRTVT